MGTFTFGKNKNLCSDVAIAVLLICMLNELPILITNHSPFTLRISVEDW
jgi:hypothetical protein